MKVALEGKQRGFFPQYVKHEIKVEVDLQGFERQQETSSRLFS